MTSNLSDVWFQLTDLELASGHGCWVTTTDGVEYLDFTSGIAVTSTGHCHPDVVAAITDQASKFIHAQVNCYRHELLEPLAARLAEITPARHRPVLLHQLRGRGDRGGGEAGPPGHAATQPGGVRGQLPRTHGADDGDDDLQERLPGRACAAAGRRLRGAVPPSDPHRGGRRGFDRPVPRRLRLAAGHPDRAGRDRGGGHRTGAGRRRLPARSRRLPRGDRRPLRRARHPVRGRRGAVGVRPHRHDVRHRPVRRDPRHRRHGQGHRLGVPDRGHRHHRRPSRPGGRRAHTAAPTAATRWAAPRPWPPSTS